MPHLGQPRGGVASRQHRLDLHLDASLLRLRAEGARTAHRRRGRRGRSPGRSRGRAGRSPGRGRSVRWPSRTGRSARRPRDGCRALGAATVGEVLHADVAQGADRGVQQAQVDEVTATVMLTSVQRGADRRCGVSGGERVDDRQRMSHGTAVDVAGQRHSPDSAWRIGSRPGWSSDLATRRRRSTRRSCGVGLPELDVAEPEAVHHARAEVLDDDVAAGDQAACQLLTTGPRQIDRDAALRPVERQEGQRLARHRWANGRAARRRSPDARS